MQILFYKQSVLTGEAPPPTAKQPLPACLSVNDVVLCVIVLSEATLTFQSEHVVGTREGRRRKSKYLTDAPAPSPQREDR